MMISKGGSPPLDVLVRTSGVKRLSDYLLWQVCRPDAASTSTSAESLCPHIDTSPVLGGHADPVLRHVLARLWTLRLHTHYFRLPAKSMVHVTQHCTVEYDNACCNCQGSRSCVGAATVQTWSPMRGTRTFDFELLGTLSVMIRCAIGHA